MKKIFLCFVLTLALIVPLIAWAYTFDGTRPTNTELLSAAPALIRENFNALKELIDGIVADYATTAEVALKADKTYVDNNFATTGEVALKAYSADVYTTGEIDLKFLNYYTTAEVDLKLGDYYDTGEVDGKLLLKFDAADIASYYTKLETDALLNDKATTASVALKLDILTAQADYATTASVALKANSADVYTTGEINLMLDDKADTSSVTAVAGDLADHTAEVAAHGHISPVGQVANRLEVTDGAGGWMLTSVAAAGGGVTNAVDLNVATGSFSRLMNSLANNGQTALEQIDVNAATTAEVAAKATPAQVSEEVLVHNAVTTNVHGIADTTALATKAMTSEEVAVHNEDTNAHLAKFAAIPLATAIEDTAVFVSSNVFEFDTDYDTSAVVLYRNGIMQPRRLFTTEDVSSKTRVTFISAVNDSDEIILISNK